MNNEIIRSKGPFSNYIALVKNIQSRNNPPHLGSNLMTSSFIGGSLLTTPSYQSKPVNQYIKLTSINKNTKESPKHLPCLIVNQNPTTPPLKRPKRRDKSMICERYSNNAYVRALQKIGDIRRSFRIPEDYNKKVKPEILPGRKLLLRRKVLCFPIVSKNPKREHKSKNLTVHSRNTRRMQTEIKTETFYEAKETIINGTEENIVERPVFSETKKTFYSKWSKNCKPESPSSGSDSEVLSVIPLDPKFNDSTDYSKPFHCERTNTPIPKSRTNFGNRSNSQGNRYYHPDILSKHSMAQKRIKLLINMKLKNV